MAKKRTMNEYRQTKEHYISPMKQIMAQQIDEEMLQAHGKYDGDINKEEEIEECPLDPVEEAKILIVDKITKHFHDVMFEMVNEEMDKNYLFQSQNYFTDAGYDQFEDEWFEFYHEHHGDIMYEVMQNITN